MIALDLPMIDQDRRTTVRDLPMTGRDRLMTARDRPMTGRDLPTIVDRRSSAKRDC